MFLNLFKKYWRSFCEYKDNGKVCDQCMAAILKEVLFYPFDLRDWQW